MRDSPPSTCRFSGAALILGLLVFLVDSVSAQHPWQGRPVEEWTQKETLAALTDSPWAKDVVVSYFSGRLVEEVREGERHYVGGLGRPTIPVPTREVYREPERVQARYRVWWSSAAVVQQARQRLLQLAPPAVVEAQAPPPLLSSQHYVLTVQSCAPVRD